MQNCLPIFDVSQRLCNDGVGVISLAWEGEDKNKVVVIGDGVDAATLTRNLSKKLGFADLLLVKKLRKRWKKRKIQNQLHKDHNVNQHLR